MLRERGSQCWWWELSWKVYTHGVRCIQIAEHDAHSIFCFFLSIFPSYQ